MGARHWCLIVTLDVKPSAQGQIIDAPPLVVFPAENTYYLLTTGCTSSAISGRPSCVLTRDSLEQTITS